jgi:hypothetical protein
VVSRRLVIAGAAGLTVAALPLTRAFGGTDPSVAIPQTLVKPRGLLTDGVRIAEGSFPLTQLNVSWRAEAAAAIRLRTAAGWGDWQPLDGCQRGADGAIDAQACSAAIATPGGVGYELGVKNGGAAAVTEINTVDGPVRALAPAAAKRMPLAHLTTPVRYLSRAAWGADESYRFNGDGAVKSPTVYVPVQTLTVHHSGGDHDNDLTDPAAFVRGIYYGDIFGGKGLTDMGYHLLIDEAGTVYEGRWSGDDRFPIFGGPLGSDGRPQMANGAHVAGWNAGNIGVCLLGNLMTRQPTAAAIESLTCVLAILAKVCRLDPLGTTNYVNPISGAAKTVRTISAHRDWAATLCPGDDFYPLVPGLRQAVADRLR